MMTKSVLDHKLPPQWRNFKFDITGTLVKDILDKEITPITIPLTPINIGKLLIVGLSSALVSVQNPVM